MATWFSDPVEWQSNMTLRAQPDSSMYVLVNNGPVVLKALFDGFVVFRKTSNDGAPVVGNLELVLVPGNWSAEMQTFFNPGYPKEKGIQSGFSELPPGRVVYRNIARGDIEPKLHELIFTKFNAWRGDNTKTHKVLYYIIEPADSTILLKDVLLAEWNKGISETDAKKRVDEKITETLDKIFATGLLNPLGNSLPVEGADTLASIGTAALPVELIFEIRNLYGEPINPHFYLRKLEKPTGALTPRPPFRSDDDQTPRKKTSSDQPLPIRLPRQSGVVFSLMNGAGGSPPFQSQLIWTHKLDTADADYPTKVEARPGQSPTVPQVDPGAQARVNAMWDNDHVAINKYAEFFSCPCELILATIKRESAQWVDTLGATHSIRFEEIPQTADYATDHEDLRKAGSPLTRSCLDAYWKIAGGCHTDVDKSFYEAENKEIKTEDLPKLALTDLVESTTKIGTDNTRKLISWAQIQKIETVKASLIERSEMILPALGATHYDLIKAQVSEDAAKQYFAKVGGIGAAGDAAKPPTPFKLNDYPLPIKTKGDVMVVDGTMKWKDVLAVLKVLRTSGVSDVPKATYTLQPLEKEADADIHDKFTIPQLMKHLKPIDKPTAKAVVDHYIQLMTKNLQYHENTTTPDDSKIKDHDNPSDTIFLTLKQTKAMSRIYPHRISIGVGQILLDTGVRRVIGFVKKHYPASFFTELGATVPTDRISEKITWLWTELWDKRDLQIALIAAYHKQNATAHWQSIDDDDAHYRVGERMTMFDFPKSGACYNAGSVRKTAAPKPGKPVPDAPWGMVTFGDYQTGFWSAVAAAAKRFNTFSSPDPKWAKVRLRPDLETDSGMDAR
jgi:hypothetical protein